MLPMAALISLLYLWTQLVVHQLSGGFATPFPHTSYASSGGKMLSFHCESQLEGDLTLISN